jgi:hypothetical protein
VTVQAPRQREEKIKRARAASSSAGRELRIEPGRALVGIVKTTALQPLDV